MTEKMSENFLSILDFFNPECKVYYDPCDICLHYGNQIVRRPWSSYVFIGDRSSDAERPIGSLQE